VRKREKTRRKRGGGREEGTSTPLVFFLLTSLCAVLTIWTPGTDDWFLGKNLAMIIKACLNYCPYKHYFRFAPHERAK